MPQPRDIAQETVDELRTHLPPLSSLTPDQQKLAEEIILRAVIRQMLRDIWQVWNYAGPDIRESLLELIQPEVLLRDAFGQPVTANQEAKHWREWYPGLENDSQTLGEVMDRLPGFAADEIPALVRLFENPESPIALTGACTLAQHDAIHVLIGRGLLDQDEAFTIGFTAGTCKEQLTEDQKQAYRVILQAYAEPYRIHGKDLLAFDLGVKAGIVSPCRNIHQIDVSSMRLRRLGDLREEVGIDVELLRGFYRLEQQILPNTPASIRLPV